MKTISLKSKNTMTGIPGQRISICILNIPCRVLNFLRGSIEGIIQYELTPAVLCSGTSLCRLSLCFPYGGFLLCRKSRYLRQTRRYEPEKVGGRFLFSAQNIPLGNFLRSIPPVLCLPPALRIVFLSEQDLLFKSFYNYITK